MDDWNDAAQVMEAAQQLAAVLKESSLYHAYRKSRIQLERHPDVAAQLKHFKQLHTEFESKTDYNFDEEKAISYHYAELMRHPAAAAFMERERVLLDTYSKMIDLLDASWEIDLF